jgi:predicted CoA-binding protein
MREPEQDLNPSDEEIRGILSKYQKITVVGLSPNAEKPSYGVTRYMADQGYQIFGVHPGVNEIMGHSCFPGVALVPGELEIVDVFRRTDALPELFEDLIPLQPKVIWLQEGITHPACEERARKAGITVVSNRCILKEHMRLC